MIVLVGVVNVSLFLAPVASLPIQSVLELVLVFFQFVLGLSLVVFLPGYVFVAALFPRSSRGTRERNDGVVPDHIDVVERMGLSFGISIAIVASIGFVLNLSPVGLRRFPIVVSISGFVVITAIVATVRRYNLPRVERFSLDTRGRIRRMYSSLGGNSRVDLGLNLLLIVSIVIAVGSVGYVFSVPTEGEQSTEFYMLSETDDGDLIIGGYPTSFAEGEVRPVTLQIKNEEYERMDYTVVVELQRIRTEDGATTVVERRELDRLSAAGIEHNTTWTRQYDIEPTMTGDRMRVVFMLYRGSAPEDAAIGDAYRDLKLQVNVTE